MAVLLIAIKKIWGKNEFPVVMKIMMKQCWGQFLSGHPVDRRVHFIGRWRWRRDDRSPLYCYAELTALCWRWTIKLIGLSTTRRPDAVVTQPSGLPIRRRLTTWLISGTLYINPLSLKPWSKYDRERPIQSRSRYELIPTTCSLLLA